MLTIRQSDCYVRFCEVTMFLQSKIYTRVVTDRILAKYLEPADLYLIWTWLQAYKKK